VTFDRPVDVAAARSAFSIEPAVAGQLHGDAATGPTGQLTFMPDEGLASGTRYTVSLSGPLLDTTGAPVSEIQPLVVQTVVAPAVVRFRPRSGSEDVDPGAAISVRFTLPMDRAASQRAFVVTAAGARLMGDYVWAENDTVVVFDPRDPLPAGTEVVMSVTSAAAGADGTPIQAAVTARFTTAAKPAATPRPTQVPRPKATSTKTAPKPKPRPTPGTSPSKATPTTDGEAGGADLERGRVERRWPVGLGGALLPQPSQLHARRRPRNGIRRVFEPRRERHCPARARRRDQQHGLAALREAPRDHRRLQPLPTAGTPGIGSGRRGTRAIAGLRTWAASPLRAPSHRRSARSSTSNRSARGARRAATGST